MEEEAVSESGLHGFRRRRSEQSAVLDDSDLQDLEDPLDVDKLIPELDLQDNHWEAEAFSFDDDSKDGGSDQLENRSQHSAAIPHLQATAKSRPQPSSSSSGYDRQSVKRLADDLACRAIHKRWKDMTQPWQVGPWLRLADQRVFGNGVVSNTPLDYQITLGKFQHHQFPLQHQSQSWPWCLNVSERHG